MQTSTIQQPEETMPATGGKLIYLVADNSKKAISRKMGLARVIPFKQGLLPGAFLKMRKLANRAYVKSIYIFETIKCFI